MEESIAPKALPRALPAPWAGVDLDIVRQGQELIPQAPEQLLGSSKRVPAPPPASSSRSGRPRSPESRYPGLSGAMSL